MASPSQGNSQGNSQAVQGLQAQAGTFIPQPPRLELGDFENLAGKWRARRQRWNAFAAISGLNASGDEDYKTGLLVSVADDETLKIIDQVWISARSEEAEQSLGTFGKALSTGCQCPLRKTSLIPETAR